MIIVLSGKARSGKDTVADILEDLFIENFEDVVSIAYADYLKEIVGKAFGLNDRHLYGDLKEEPIKNLPIRSRSGLKTQHHWTPRKLFQYIGTDIFRRIDPDCWLNVVKNEVLSNRAKASYIITDARFENEINWAMEAGGIHIHIERDNKDFCSDTKHASETSLPEFEEAPNRYVVKNNGTLEDLEYKLSKILKTWRNQNGRKEICA